MILATSLLLAAAIGVQAFVRPSGTKFVDECGEFLPHGWNTYVVVCLPTWPAHDIPLNRWNQPLMDLAVAAAANPSGAEAAQIMKSFADGQAAGMNTMRMFLQPVDGTPNMQIAPGMF